MSQLYFNTVNGRYCYNIIHLRCYKLLSQRFNTVNGKGGCNETWFATPVQPHHYELFQYRKRQALLQQIEKNLFKLLTKTSFNTVNGRCCCNFLSQTLPTLVIHTSFNTVNGKYCFNCINHGGYGISNCYWCVSIP